MDSLLYHYYWWDNGVLDTYTYRSGDNQWYWDGSWHAMAPDSATNRLAYVDDILGAQVSSAWNDLGDQSPDNYEYDKIGQLVRDDYEDLDMEWTAYHKVASVNKNASTTGAVSEIIFGYDAMQHRVTKLVEHLSSSDYEKSYYIYDAQGNVMAIYSANNVSSVVTTKQDELPIYGSDRLGLVRRNLELGDQTECPYCPETGTIQPGMLRIVEVMYDSPLTSGTETNEGEFIVLRNATGITIPLASVSVTYPGGVFTFGGSDVLAPYEFAIVARLSGSSPSSFATLYGLTGYGSDPEVNWFWHNTMTLPDAGGTVGLLDFTDGVPTLLDAVNFGGSGIAASNGTYCASACSTAQTVQLDNFLTSPSGAFDAGEWSGATITGKGSIGSGSFVLDNSYERELGLREYELKDHLGNVRVVVSDKKLSRINGGLPVEFRADVLLERDFYAFGMEMPGGTFTPDAYRYGFNGMERDDEVKGGGDSYDFGARMYDPRIGRWWSKDFHEGKYPSFAAYVFVENMPIVAIDPNGKDIFVVIAHAMKNNNDDADPGHARIYATTYERVIVKAIENGIEVKREYFVMKGVSLYENWPNSTPPATQVIGETMATLEKELKVSASAYVIKHLEKSEGVLGSSLDTKLNPQLDDNRRYYTLDEIQEEWDLQKEGERRESLGLDNKFSFGDFQPIGGQNDCSSFVVEILTQLKYVSSGTKFGWTGGVYKGIPYAKYTPNKIAKDLEALGFPKIILNAKEYSEVTEKNAHEYIQNRIDERSPE